MEIDRLTDADVNDAWRLSTQAGWNQTRADWRRFLDLFAEGCFAGRIDGELVATSALATYDGTVGWIGMVLVEAEHRRQGYGSALFERALEAGHERDLEIIGLDATDAGAAVYETYGFESVVGIDRWAGTPSRPAESDGGGVRETSAVEEVEAVDISHAGVDRCVLLGHLLGSRGTTALVRGSDADEGIDGYAILRPGRVRPHIGPLVADRRADAAALLAAVADRFDTPVSIDAIRGESTTELLSEFDFEVQRCLRRMTHDDPRPALTNDGVFAAAGFEWG